MSYEKEVWQGSYIGMGYISMDDALMLGVTGFTFGAGFCWVLWSLPPV